MMSAPLGARHMTLERAMREWARTDDAVAASVRAADQRILDAVRLALLDYGFEGEDADLRANAERPRCGTSGALPRPQYWRADPGRPYLKVWYVRRYDGCSGDVAGHQPRIRRKAGRARAGGRGTAQTAQQATVDDFIPSEFAELLVPARHGDAAAPWPAILHPVRRMAHGCASTACWPVTWCSTTTRAASSPAR